MTATDLFNRALITLAVRGERPRCSDPVDHARWTSEDQSDRDIAALCCTGCEVLRCMDLPPPANVIATSGQMLILDSPVGKPFLMLCLEPPRSGEYPHRLGGLIALDLDLPLCLKVLLVGDLLESTPTL
jgi:hypothetical protein